MKAYDRIYSVLIEMCQKCKDEGTSAAKKAPEGKKQVAYNKARREAENRRHGKPGETPRQTQVRRHGGRGMAARRSSGLGATTPKKRKKK